MTQIQKKTYREIIEQTLRNRTGAVSRAEIYAVFENNWVDEHGNAPDLRMVARCLCTLVERGNLRMSRYQKRGKLLNENEKRARDTFELTSLKPGKAPHKPTYLTLGMAEKKRAHANFDIGLNSQYINKMMPPVNPRKGGNPVHRQLMAQIEQGGTAQHAACKTQNTPALNWSN